MEAYCVKCRAKREMKEGKLMEKGGRRFTIGKCSVCGTKMARIMGKEK